MKTIGEDMRLLLWVTIRETMRNIMFKGIAGVLALTLFHLIVTVAVMLTALPIAFSTGPDASPADIAAAEAWAKAVEVMTFPVYPILIELNIPQVMHDVVVAFNSLLWGLIIYLTFQLLMRLIKPSESLNQG